MAASTTSISTGLTASLNQTFKFSKIAVMAASLIVSTALVIFLSWIAGRKGLNKDWARFLVYLIRTAGLMAAFYLMLSTMVAVAKMTAADVSGKKIGIVGGLTLAVTGILKVVIATIIPVGILVVSIGVLWALGLVGLIPAIGEIFWGIFSFVAIIVGILALFVVVKLLLTVFLLPGIMTARQETGYKSYKEAAHIINTRLVKLLGWFLVTIALMGLFYGFMWITRRRLVHAVLGVLVTQMGIWVLLDKQELGFLLHPQFWLIPPALVALVAEMLNHDRLTKAQTAALRYLALSVIYVSSAADMFIAGVGDSWALPMVLMLLCVAGALSGILLQIRSFLYLGVTFLLVDVASIIWHAAVDLRHTWIWYACGITLGAAIIALFALFEKRRNNLLAAVERFKQWEE